MPGSIKDNLLTDRWYAI